MTPEEIDTALVSVLPAQSLYVVGGRVRDEISNAIHGTSIEIKDSDYLVTGVPFEDLATMVAPLGRVDRVGESFSILKLTIDGVTVDLALPRVELSTGSGHREFTITCHPDIPIEDDLGRRDFTINALARALPSGKLIDPFNGAGDIRDRSLRMCSRDSFLEDPLRLLRALQFISRFDYDLNVETFSAMSRNAELVKTVTRDRIFVEFTKLLHGPFVLEALDMMEFTGVLNHLIPELIEGQGLDQENQYHRHSVLDHNFRTCEATPKEDLVLRLAGLLHDVGKPRVKDGSHYYNHECVGAELVGPILERIGCPNKIAEQVTRLVRNHMFSIDPTMSNAAVRRSIRRIGVDLLDAQLLLRRADVIGSGFPERLAQEEAFELRARSQRIEAPVVHTNQLAVNGHDVLKIGVATGLFTELRGNQVVGKILSELLEFVTDFPDLNERTVLLVLIKHKAEMRAIKNYPQEVKGDL